MQVYLTQVGYFSPLNAGWKVPHSGDTSHLREVFHLIQNSSLKISQNSPGNTCARVSFLKKLQASGLTPSEEFLFIRPATLLKKRLWHRCFTVNFVKFLWTPFFTEHRQRLVLIIYFQNYLSYQAKIFLVN